MLWRTVRRRVPSPSAPPVAPPGGLLRSFSRGVVTNLLNPKIGVFYLATGVLWFALLITVAQLARRFLDGGRARRIMDRITGTVLIGFGLKLVFSHR